MTKQESDAYFREAVEAARQGILDRGVKKARANVLPSPTQGHQPPSVPLPKLKHHIK